MKENFLHQAAKASAELFHSNMLSFLWRSYPDLANAHLCSGIPSRVNVHPDEVAREKLNIDVLVVSDAYVVAVENKFKSRHTAEQLNNYQKKLKKAYPGRAVALVALCTTKLDAQDTKERLGAKVNVTFASYEENVVRFVQAIISRAQMADDKRSLFYLNDYLDVIRDLLAVVKRHKATARNLGVILRDIAIDEDVVRFRLSPLLQRRLFERVLGMVLGPVDEECDLKSTSYEFNEVNLGSRSKQGQITARLTTPIAHDTFFIHIGVQLEGTELRRFVTFEKIDGSAMTPKNKADVHQLATRFARSNMLFADKAGDAMTPQRPKHFKAGDGLDPFLAYVNTKSVYFIYLGLTADCSSLNLDEVAKRVRGELVRLEGRFRAIAEGSKSSAATAV